MITPSFKDNFRVNCRILRLLAIFLLAEASTPYAPTVAALIEQQQSVVFPINKDRITSVSNTSVDQVPEVRTSGKYAIAQCSPEEFKSFFELFVRGALGRDKYISSAVQIRDYQDPSLLVMVIADKDYVDFWIGAIGNKYVNLAPFTKYTSNAELLKNRLKLDFQKIDAKTFRVNYISAEFLNDKKEGEATLVRTYGSPEAYIFEHSDGCWRLTQSLRQYRAWKESKTYNKFTEIPLIFSIPIDGGGFYRLGKDEATYNHDRVLTAYTDLFYYKKLDAQFGYRIWGKRDRWREWNVIREAVDHEFGFWRSLQCSGKYFVRPRFGDYDDASVGYTSQALDRIATAIVGYQTSQAELHLSPEAVKNRWLEIRKKISINIQDACSLLGN